MFSMKEKTTLRKKFLIVQEGLESIDIDRSLEYLLVFIDEERGNLKIVSLIMDCLLEILSKRRVQTFYMFIVFHYVTNVICKIVSSLRMWNIAN